MRIKDIAEENRPRERLQKLGADALSDAELLAIILQKGTAQENVIDMSNRLISKYGPDKLSTLSLTELQEIKGIGPAKAMQIKALFELAKRSNTVKNSLTTIKSSKDVFNLFKEQLKEEKQEKFIVLLLNSKNKIIGKEVISLGTLDCALLHPREVFKSAIKNSATKIILAHNHPSGDPAPSEADRKITGKLIEAGETLNIPVIDHVIIGEEKWWSWKEERN
ncbi:MAG: DNA repair protein RadC [Nanoarchaeota archaeon]